MGDILSPCHAPRQDEDEDDDDEDHFEAREVSETWVCSQMAVQQQWVGVQTPWACNRCGAVWHKQ